MEKKEAILCVDDEVIILFSIVQELKHAFGGRFQYEQAIDAEQALAAVEELSREGILVIFIITDWLMPGMKGDEFLEVVQGRYPEIRAIMITGQADQDAINRVKRNSSVLTVLRKPWDPEELVRIIRENSGPGTPGQGAGEASPR